MKMDSFAYKNSALTWQSAEIRPIAAKFGTPLYIYSEAAIESRVLSLRGAFGSRRAGIYYSVKACSNLHILRILAALGCGADIVSGGELYRCRQAGIPGDAIVFSGVGKTEDEIRYAITEDILFFSVESEAELDEIARIAAAMKKTARISVRVNPDVNPNTHPYISTGLKENKFGISHKEVGRIYEKAQDLPWIEPTGLGFHIGSQITDLRAFADAGRIAARLVSEIEAAGIKLKHLDVGGGLGIRYRSDEAEDSEPDPADYVRTLIESVGLPHLDLMFDPGRSIVGNAGVLVTKILYVKRSEKTFFISDAGMNDLIRPSLYEAYHHVYSDPERRNTEAGDLVGPVCESGDFFAKDRELPRFESGDLAVLASAGAYGMSMASNYNSRPRAAEVLIEKSGQVRLIRRRENYQDLLRPEIEIS